jgi:hypothetical protein
VDLGICARGFDVRVRCAVDGERDVFADGAFVERGLLGDEADVRAVCGGREGGYVLRIEQDGAACGGVEELEEGYGGGFAAGGWVSGIVVRRGKR